MLPERFGKGRRKDEKETGRSNIDESMKKNKKKERKIMAANVETMFYSREKPWHGLGTRVE